MKTIIRCLTAAGLCACLAGGAAAKLPAPSDEAKAKAAETAARNAWNDKVAAFQLCQSMDRVAAAYYANAKKAGHETKPATTTPPCSDPGPFNYTPPDQKPLEAAGAHSPPGTAVSPNNTNTPAAASQAASAAKKP